MQGTTTATVAPKSWSWLLSGRSHPAASVASMPAGKVVVGQTGALRGTGIVGAGGERLLLGARASSAV
eukprot:2602432-Rhodomonas_salina.1